MKLKRYLTLFLALVLCLSLIGCGKKTAEYEEEGFVLITDVIPDAILEIRYYSTFNFVGERINSYEAPVAYLTKEAAAALKNVSDELMAQGYRIKIYDAYRPQTAVDHFKAWAEDPEATECHLQKKPRSSDTH